MALRLFFSACYVFLQFLGDLQVAPGTLILRQILLYYAPAGN